LGGLEEVWGSKRWAKSLEPWGIEFFKRSKEKNNEFPMLGDLVEGIAVSFHLSQFHARNIRRDDCLDHG
jgi:hypothetical protein